MEPILRQSRPLPLESPVTIDSIPKDVLESCIFRHLGTDDLLSCSRVKRTWKVSVDISLRRRIEQAAFGKEKWAEYWCEIAGEVPPIPEELFQVYKSHDPLRKGQGVFHNHDTPVFLPRFVKLPDSDEPVLFTREILKLMIENPRKGYAMKLFDSCSMFKGKTGDLPIGDGRWHLFSNNIIPKTKNQHPDSLKDIFKNCKRCRSPQQSEAILSIAAKYVASGERIYSNEPYLRVDCEDEINGEIIKSTAGGLDLKGELTIGGSFHYWAREHNGIGTLWKF